MTSNKERYRYRILKTYSILVDFDGEPHLENVPGPKPSETFKRWKSRVLGDEVSNVQVYVPYDPTSNTRMSTIQSWSPRVPLRKTLRVLNAERNKALREAEVQGERAEAIEKSYSTLPKEMLKDLMEGREHPLEPSVREFLQRFVDDKREDIPSDELLSALISYFNSNVRELRKCKEAQEDLRGPTPE